ncbi:MAG: repressor LexA [Spirochaetes bacterium GWF1_41_5]|nr:MAG: repressor LexA [Spirochaetes bacterium GWF1_41_5]HBE04552.1 repressor LexA [Spirochaetia bacterium]
MYLTPGQKKIYGFIKKQLAQTGICPSFDEIRKFCGLSAKSTVSQYIKTLVKKGYLEHTDRHAKRALVPADDYNKYRVPLLGSVAAGLPIEIFEEACDIEVPPSLLCGGENIALRVRGSSMIEAGIYDGDIVIIRQQSSAENGQIVAALVGGLATIKTFYKKNGQIELHPENPSLQPLIIKNPAELQIHGVLVGLFRKFR